MKILLHGSVDPLPEDRTQPVKALRIRIRQAQFADDVTVVEGIPLSDPVQTVVIFDKNVPIADGARLAAAFENVARQVRRHVGAFEQNGGRSNPE